MIINTILTNYHLIIINICLSFESQVTQLSYSAAVDSQAWVRTNENEPSRRKHVFFHAQMMVFHGENDVVHGENDGFSL